MNELINQVPADQTGVYLENKIKMLKPYYSKESFMIGHLIFKNLNQLMIQQIMSIKYRPCNVYVFNLSFVLHPKCSPLVLRRTQSTLSSIVVVHLLRKQEMPRFDFFSSHSITLLLSHNNLIENLCICFVHFSHPQFLKHLNQLMYIKCLLKIIIQ